MALPEPTILTAIILAFPPTLAAGAAWLSAFKTNRQVATKNGHNLGDLVEITVQEQRTLTELLMTHTQLDEERFRELSEKIDAL